MGPSPDWRLRRVPAGSSGEELARRHPVRAPRESDTETLQQTKAAITAEGGLMRDFGLVVVGGGLASARAIKAYREAGGDRAIALLSSDAVLPYHRPPLSKGYLRDETDEAPFVEDEAFYTGNDVELLLRTAVCALDPGAHSLTTENGRRYS